MHRSRAIGHLVSDYWSGAQGGPWAYAVEGTAGTDALPCQKAGVAFSPTGCRITIRVSPQHSAILLALRAETASRRKVETFLAAATAGRETGVAISGRALA